MAINQNFNKDDFNLAVSWQILLVEDNIINQEVARGMLTRMGCNVQIAVNGLEAVVILEQKKFDLILMDCNMPELDGYGATRKIRELEQNKSNIPIIAFTTDIMPEIRERCFEAGMDDFLAKPLIFKNLQGILSKWLGSKNIENSEVQNLDMKNSVNSDNKQLPNTETTEIESSIDLNILNDMRQNLLADQAVWLIDLYLRALPTYLTTIDSAITLQKGEDLYLAAHKFKGASAILGAQRVVALCKSLETSGRDQKFAGTTELFATLQKECGYLTIFLAKHK